jgi:hypothetical protein
MDVSAVHAALAEKYYTTVSTAARHMKQPIDERFRALFSRRNLRGDALRRALHQDLASPHLTSHTRPASPSHRVWPDLRLIPAPPCSLLSSVSRALQT